MPTETEIIKRLKGEGKTATKPHERSRDNNMNNNHTVRWIAVIVSVFLALFLFTLTFSLSSAARIGRVELRSEVQDASLTIQLKNMNERLGDIYELLEIRIKPLDRPGGMSGGMER